MEDKSKKNGLFFSVLHTCFLPFSGSKVLGCFRLIIDDFELTGFLLYFFFGGVIDLSVCVGYM